MKVVTHSPEETEEFGRKLGLKLKGDELIALYGELGSGKTVLVRGIIKGAGCKDVEVKSPSFIWVVEYECRFKVFHVDLYRGEMDFPLLWDYLRVPGVVVIEWADRVVEYLPGGRIDIFLEIVGETERVIEMKVVPLTGAS